MLYSHPFHWSTAKLGVPAGVVAEATEKFLRASAKAFGTEGTLWKHHAILHHSQYVERWGWSPHTLPLERKHKSILKYGEDHQKDTKAVIREVVAESFFILQDAPWLDLDIGLIAPTAPTKKLQKFLTDTFNTEEHRASGKARFNEFDVAWVRDVIALKSSGGWIAARVIFFASSWSVPYAAVQPFKCLESHPWHSTWTKFGDPMLADLEDFIEVLTVRGNDGVLTVLHPLALVA